MKKLYIIAFLFVAFLMISTLKLEANDFIQNAIVKENSIELKVNIIENALDIKVIGSNQNSIKFEVYDISGKRIKTFNSDQLQIQGESFRVSLSDFNSGIYILNATSNELKLAKRFVVKR